MVAGCASASAGTGGSAPKVASIPAQTASAAEQKAAKSLNQGYASLYKTVSPSVVQIATSSDLGSGVIFNSSGDIVTNNHVANGKKTFTVTLANGKQYQGTLVNNFAPDDLAVIHINASGLHPATFANSSQLQVGDLVMAIGNPLGFQSSATTGIVSALGRTVSEPNGVTLPNAIQTSAPINPGNSGGALVDLEGQVIGIPTLAAVDQQLGGEASGIGFAIPSNVVAAIAGQIVKHGHVINSGRAFIGVEVDQVTNSSGADAGVLVTKVSRAAAAKAGLKPQDVILAVDGHQTLSVSSLTDLLATKKPGQVITLKIKQPNGSQTTIHLKLGELPATSG